MAEISSIATQSPLTLRPTDQLREAIDIMAKHGFRRLPVVYEFEVVGMITASDVIKVLMEGNVDLISQEIYNFMTENPLLYYQDENISDAVDYMMEANLNSLPLISRRDHFLMGIVTERDLVKAFVHSIADADLEGFVDENPLKMVMKGKTIGKCIQAMVKNSCSRVIFVNSKKKVEGIVTVKDIIKFYHNEILSYGNPPDDVLKRNITEIAVKDVYTVNINQTVAEVSKVMMDHKIGGVPVINDENQFVGMFTERDVLKLIWTYGLFREDKY